MRTLIYSAVIAGLIGAPIASLSAAKMSPQDKLAKLTAGRVAGKPVDCINLGITNNESQKIPGIGMAYRQGTTWYVSRFKDGCPDLREDTVVVTKLHSSQLCRGDIADLRMIPPNMPVGSCVFDSFVPYRKE